MENDSLLLPGERAVAAGGRVSIITDGTGLAWGTDAWLLAAFVRRRRRMCELGSGCGVVSLLCAAYKKSSDVTGLELLPAAADRSNRSAELSGLSGSVRFLCRDIRDVRYTDPDIGGRFGAVFANPPYIAHPGRAPADPAADAARHELNGTLADFCSAAARLLDHRGSFYCVFRPDRLPDLFSAMRAARIEPKRLTEVYPDTVSPPSLVLCEGVLGAAPGLQVSPPLFIFRDGPDPGRREHTARMERIYETCSFT